MLRSNLSTRPFYNERAVHLWLFVFALVIVAATIFNVTSVYRYSRSDTELGVQADRDETRAADLRQQAARLRATVDPRQIEFASSEARQANNLIDRRTFSWTELFNRFEATLPDDVRITAVRPKVEKGQITLSLTVIARSYEELERFMNNMEDSGFFLNPLSHEDHVDDKAQFIAAVDTIYLPGASLAQAGQP